ncbi:MAG: LPXTG cell wall anchor domain-containing protein [Bacteroidetes bacterium]|nr:LPXTG cell wall anchor domain-containing protein [Bacteroidota bacterium]
MMRKSIVVFLFIFWALGSDSYNILKAGDSVAISMDTADKLTSKMQGNKDSSKIDEAGNKMDEVKQARKPNYWMPIFGGAILGLGLAYWLRSRKSK